MHNLGLKIYGDDKEIPEQEIISFQNDFNSVLEISFFKDNKYNERTNRILKRNYNYVYHSNYNLFCLFRYFQDKATIKDLKKELVRAKSVNATKMVLHLDHRFPFPSFVNRESRIFFEDLAVKMLEDLQAIESFEDLPICIENTYNHMEIYKAIIIKARAKGLNVGFTFDLGHAKVWGANSLQEWKNFLVELHTKEIPLHMHLHWNNGLYDQHKSIFSKDKDFKPEFYSDLQKELLWVLNTLPNATKILEYDFQRSLRDLYQIKQIVEDD